MWKCHKCGKPVYFAERKTSLGYEWHPECLRCEECGKRLNPGQHAEHKGVPYCHIPCYSLLFGPTLFGHGSQVEAHTSFGKKIENRHRTMVSRCHLEAKLRIYNQYFEGKSGTIQSRERNGRLILEGSLRIFWGVNNTIHLKEDHDDRIPVRRRNSCQFSPESRLSNRSKLKNEEMLITKPLTDDKKRELIEKYPNILNSSLPVSVDEAVPVPRLTLEILGTENVKSLFKTFPAGGLKACHLNSVHSMISADGCVKHNYGNLKLPQKSKLVKSKLKRRCSINGHFYNRETSIFTPAHGSVTSVWVTSLVTAPEVINLLLDKFKVVNNPEDFALYVVRDTGESRHIQDNEYPLLTRVMLGPSEDVAKVFIMAKNQAKEITGEVAQYLNFSDVELRSFLHKFHEEECRETRRIIMKYETEKYWIKALMQELRVQETGL